MSDTACTATALCRELPAEAAAPEWLMLVPAGQFAGRDERAWVNDAPEAIVSEFATHGADLPADWEHATEHKGPKGEPAPAAGWITELENRDGAIWGRVDWTQRARNQINRREYRYYSVVFDYVRQTGRVVRITSLGLTNRPNLFTRALNREQETEPMALATVIAAALGLQSSATEEQALAAIDKLKADHATALNRAENPPLERFVPRADHDQLLERASNAEQALADDRKARREAEIDIAIEQALAAKKIEPSTVDYHRAMCRQERGLDAFRKYVEIVPERIDTSIDVSGKKGDETDTALNAKQQGIAAAFGNSADDLAQYG